MCPKFPVAVLKGDTLNGLADLPMMSCSIVLLHRVLLKLDLDQWGTSGRRLSEAEN